MPPANPRIGLLDHLVKTYPHRTRDELYRCIMCSEVTVNGAVVREPGERIPLNAAVVIQQKRFVSRAGEKLEGALAAWNIGVEGTVWLDAGASTGGFTDALLQRGATAVHAVDVGYNQLDYRLRVDPRVYVHERTNILDVADLDPIPDHAVCDLSFRSLRGVLVHILELTRTRSGIALLKPQFEADAEVRWGQRPEGILDGGVLVPGLRDEVIAGTLSAIASEGIIVEKLMESTLPGRKGNREVLLHVRLPR